MRFGWWFAVASVGCAVAVAGDGRRIELPSDRRLDPDALVDFTGPQACDSILQHGIHNETNFDVTQARWVNIRNWVCSSKSSSYSAAQERSATVGIDLSGLPVSLAGNDRNTNWGAYTETMCSDSFFGSADYYNNRTTIKTVSDSVVSAWTKCITETGTQPYASAKTPFGSGQLTFNFGSRRIDGRDKLASFRINAPTGKGNAVTCDRPPADKSILPSSDQFTCNIDVCKMCGDGRGSAVSFSFAMSEGRFEYYEWVCPKPPAPEPTTCETMAGSQQVKFRTNINPGKTCACGDGNRCNYDTNFATEDIFYTGCIEGFTAGRTNVNIGHVDCSGNIGKDDTSFIVYHGRKVEIVGSSSWVEGTLRAAKWPVQPPPPPTLCGP